jgi:hypothetical protein
MTRHAKLGTLASNLSSPPLRTDDYPSGRKFMTSKRICIFGKSGQVITCRTLIYGRFLPNLSVNSQLACDVTTTTTASPAQAAARIFASSKGRADCPAQRRDESWSTSTYLRLIPGFRSPLLRASAEDSNQRFLVLNQTEQNDAEGSAADVLSLDA